MDCCKFKKYIKKAKPAYDILKLTLYAVDIATDGYASYCYYQLGDTFWASMTLGLIFPAMIFTSIYCMYDDFIKDEQKLEKKAIFLLLSICFSPFITFYFMAYAVYDTIKGKEDASARLGFIKLTEGVLESWPQCCLQLYIIFQFLDNDTKTVGLWQYTTLSISLLTLGISISGYYIFEDSNKIVRVSFLLFGSLALVTRLLISCIFSMAIKSLWLVPMGTYIAVAFAIWQVKKLGKCPKYCQSLNKDEHKCILGNGPNFPISIVVTAVFNSFTRSGLLIGAVTLGYSIGGYYLVPGLLSIVTMSLAALSFLVNALLLVIPSFRIIGDTWMSAVQVAQADGDQTDQPDQLDQAEQDGDENIFY